MGILQNAGRALRRSAGAVMAQAFGGDGIGLEAGRVGRRLGSWIPSRVHVNTLISQSGPNTLARARYLARNNGYANSAVECFAANIIGTGIKPSWKSPLPVPDIEQADQNTRGIGDNGGPPLDDNAKDAAKAASDQKKTVHKLWNRWTKECDAEGVTDFYGLQKRVARELFIAGEVFVRLRPRFLSDGLSVPLQLELFPSEQLAIQLTMPLANGNWIRQGIEFNRIGRRVAYHFWRVNPGDLTQAPKFGERARVPASQILHIYDPLEAGQIRGLSRLTPAIVTLWMLDLYDDAELERKKTAALFSVFITRPDPDGEFFNKEKKPAQRSGDGDGAGTDDGAADVVLKPGTAHVLLDGEDVKIAAPAESGASYDPFQYRQLTRACAALGLPFAGVTGDILKANYGNQRAAMIEAKRRGETIQKSIIVFQLCLPVFRAFMDFAHIAGSLDFDGYADNPADYLDMDWIPPRWMWIDPLKDRQAEILAVDAGFKARSMSIEEEGYDAAEVDQRIAEDAARADRLGIQFSGTQSLRTIIGAPPPGGDDPDEQLAPDANGKKLNAPTRQAPPKPTVAPQAPAKP
jgi:lambda family phage portal protein